MPLFMDWGEEGEVFRGNQIKLVISKNENGQFLVKTLFDLQEADCQTVTSMEQLKDNDYVIFKRDAALAETAGLRTMEEKNGDSSNICTNL